MKTFKGIAFVLISLFLFITCSKDSSEESPEQQIKYELNVSISPEEGGTVTPNQGSYNKGQKVTITASPASGYFLKSWTGGASGSENTITITMDSNKSINANFEEIEDFATYVVSNEDWTANFIDLDTADYTIQFNKEILSSYDFQTGDVVVGTFEEGLLRRISDTSVEGNELTIFTEFVTIEEAFEELREEGSFTLTPDFDDKDFWLSDGVMMSKSTSKGQFSMTLSETLEDPDNGNSSIELTGTYDLDVDFSGIIDVSLFNIREFDVTYDLQQSKSLVAKFQSSGVFEREKRIGYIPCGHIALGPIIISPIIEVFAGVKTNYNGSVQLGATENYDNSINIAYNGQEWLYSENSTKSIELDPMELQASGDLKVYIEPKLTFLILGIIGPYLDAELYGRATGSLTNEEVSYEACLGANIGVGVFADIIGLNIFDFNTDIYTIEECPIEGNISLNAPKTFIPDNNFEQALIELGLDEIPDQYILTQNINTLESLSLSDKNISSLQGIEDFKNLKYLVCSRNNLQNVNLSENTDLEELNLQNNQLTSLDVSSNISLRKILAYENQLSNLDVSKNLSLDYLGISGNYINSIDLSNNYDLKQLYLGGDSQAQWRNNLSYIDLSSNTKLEYLGIISSNVSSVDVSQLPLLEFLNLNNSPISTLDLSNNYSLKTLALGGNSYSLQSLDLSGVPNLRELWLSDSNVSNLDLAPVQILEKLFLHRNTNLNFLDISNNNQINRIVAQDNLFECIQVSQYQLDNLVGSNDWVTYGGTEASLDCNNPNGGGNLDPNGLTPEINDLVPQWILDEMVNLGMEINTGDSPPILENTYLASPMTLIGTNLSNDSPIGSQFADYLLTVFNQNNSSLTIDVEYINGPESGTGYGSFIVGNNGDFSIFTEVNSINGNNEPARLIHVFSGRKENTGLSNFKIAVFMLDNNGNPSGTWIPNGTGRVFEDSDGFSEISTTSRRKINNSLKSLSEN